MKANERPLLLWHPVVHSVYEETLYFYLIQAETYTGTLAPAMDFRDRITRLLAKCGIHGYFLYQVFGDYDILLRVWLTRAKRERLDSALDQELGIRQIRVLPCDEVDYLWLDARDADHIADRVIDIGRAKLAPYQADPDAPNVQDTAGKLGGILLDRTRKRESGSIPDGAIKFFSLVDVKTEINYLDVVKTLKEKLQQNDGLGIEQPTVYRLGGSNSFIIKGMVRDFYLIWAFVARLATEELRFALASTSTYLVATREGVYESDDVDFSEPIDQETLVRYFHYLEVDAGLIEGQSPARRRLFETTFKEYVELGLFGLDAEHEFLSVLIQDAFVAFLEEDIRPLCRGLYGLARTEALLAIYFNRLLGELYGRRWAADSLPELQQQVNAPRERPDLMTLKQRVMVLGKVDSDHSGRVTQDLGSGWEPTLAAASVWRNQWAHGTLTNEVVQTANWKGFMDTVAALAKVVQAIERALGGQHGTCDTEQ
ncbi:MAG: hypothetical protein KKI08_08330 [Armatimonadetes bacterium]|nr:hypothetical protein [Armatimonadota bacterium]